LSSHLLVLHYTTLLHTHSHSSSLDSAFSFFIYSYVCLLWSYSSTNPGFNWVSSGQVGKKERGLTQWVSHGSKDIIFSNFPPLYIYNSGENTLLLWEIRTINSNVRLKFKWINVSYYYFIKQVICSWFTSPSFSIWRIFFGAAQSPITDHHIRVTNQMLYLLISPPYIWKLWSNRWLGIKKKRNIDNNKSILYVEIEGNRRNPSLKYKIIIYKWKANRQ
jgi:hypothetical protein